jgi:hypothetical protein
LEIPFLSPTDFPAATRLGLSVAKLFFLRLRNLGIPPGFAAPNSWRNLSFRAQPIKCNWSAKTTSERRQFYV